MALQEVFHTWAGGAEMDGRTFAKMCKECKVIDKKFTATDCDLLFTKMKSANRTINFQVFQSCMDEMSAKKGVGKGAVADAIIQSGGPSFAGATRPDAVRFHDDKSTYTGVYLQGGPTTTGDGPMELHQLLDRSPADVRGVKYDSLRKSTSNSQLVRSSSKKSNGSSGSSKNVLPDELREKEAPVSPPKTTSSKNVIKQVLPRGNSTKKVTSEPAQHALPKTQSGSKGTLALPKTQSGSKIAPVPRTNSSSRLLVKSPSKKAVLLNDDGPESQELKVIFAKFAGPDGMDGRTFVKIMADAKVGGKKNITTDADMAFTYVKMKGRNKIMESQFEAGVRQLCSRLSLDFNTVKSQIVGAGGPQYSGTVAEYNKFHDDKSTYTGVYQNGGPTTTGDGPMQLHNLLDRSPADVRGVKVN